MHGLRCRQHGVIYKDRHGEDFGERDAEDRGLETRLTGVYSITMMESENRTAAVGVAVVGVNDGKLESVGHLGVGGVGVRARFREVIGRDVAAAGTVVL